MNQQWIAFLAAQGLAEDGRSFGSIADELRVARDGEVVAPLNDLGLIRASGADAAGFLHNLLTNDIKGLAADGARFAGLCTPKGRLLALFLVWREGDDFLLMLPHDILPAVLKKLSMYILRSKVKLADASAERVLIGYSKAATVPPASNLSQTLARMAHFGVAPTEGGQSVRLDDSRWLLVLDPGMALSRWQQMTADAKPVGLAAWQWLEVAAGQPRVVAATQEAFVPQMLNMELPAVAGVSFSKGCYPGQEIVARTQFLGKVKRRTYRAGIAAEAAPGASLYAPETGDQHCGAVVSVAPSPAGGFECLVCVQIGARESGEVRVGGLDGEQLEFMSLPYALVEAPSGGGTG
jgi:folate-binding protein YgfZ